MIPVVPPPKPAPPPPRPIAGGIRVLLFLLALVWVALSRWLAGSAAAGICERLGTPAAEPMLGALFWLFLLLLGFAMLAILTGQPSSTRAMLALPRRPTARREWAVGALIGWGCALAVVLVLALRGALRVQISLSGRDLLLTLLSVLGLALLALAEEQAFRGYPFRQLRMMAGSAVAVIGMSLLFGLFSAIYPYATPLSIGITVLLGSVLSAGWLRTHGLWLSWGFNFAFKTAAAVLFGLPVNGSSSFSYAVQSFAHGRVSWTGGSFGLPASWICGVSLVGGLLVLMRSTRNYAWSYTYQPIVAGGYPVEVAPPAAHAAMEAQVAPAGTTLVQIAPVEPAIGGSAARMGAPGEDAG